MFGLYVALNETDEASGEVFWDDGDTLGNAITLKTKDAVICSFLSHNNFDIICRHNKARAVQSSALPSKTG